MKRKPFNLSGKVSGSDKVHLIKYARNFKFLLGSLSFRSGSWHLFCVWFISWFITIWGSAELISVNWELMSIIGRTLIFTLMSVPLRLWCCMSHYEWSPEGIPMRDLTPYWVGTEWGTEGCERVESIPSQYMHESLSSTYPYVGMLVWMRVCTT